MFPGTAFIARSCGNRDVKSLVSLNHCGLTVSETRSLKSKPTGSDSLSKNPSLHPGVLEAQASHGLWWYASCFSLHLHGLFPLCSFLIRTSATASKIHPKPKKIESETLSCLSKDLTLKRARFGSSRWTSSFENTLHRALRTHRGTGSVDWARVNLHIVISYLIFHGYIISFTALQSRSKTPSFP